jgi:hypothetical protein
VAQWAGHRAGPARRPGPSAGGTGGRNECGRPWGRPPFPATVAGAGGAVHGLRPLAGRPVYFFMLTVAVTGAIVASLIVTV